MFDLRCRLVTDASFATARCLMQGYWRISICPRYALETGASSRTRKCIYGDAVLRVLNLRTYQQANSNHSQLLNDGSIWSVGLQLP